MPPREHDYTQTIELAPGSLPYPATKLVITQYLKVIERDSEQQLVWLIVGAFYNRLGRPIWSREVIISKVNPSDADSSASSTSSETSGMCPLFQRANNIVILTCLFQKFTTGLIQSRLSNPLHATSQITLQCYHLTTKATGHITLTVCTNPTSPTGHIRHIYHSSPLSQ